MNKGTSSASNVSRIGTEPAIEKIQKNSIRFDLSLLREVYFCKLNNVLNFVLEFKSDLLMAK